MLAKYSLEQNQIDYLKSVIINRSISKHQWNVIGAFCTSCKKIKPELKSELSNDFKKIFNTTNINLHVIKTYRDDNLLDIFKPCNNEKISLNFVEYIKFFLKAFNNELRYSSNLSGRKRGYFIPGHIMLSNDLEDHDYVLLHEFCHFIDFIFGDESYLNGITPISNDTNTKLVAEVVAEKYASIFGEILLDNFDKNQYIKRANVHLRYIKWRKLNPNIKFNKSPYLDKDMLNYYPNEFIKNIFNPFTKEEEDIWHTYYELKKWLV